MSNDLATLEGLISLEVGQALFDLASQVPADQAIVEIGSYKGKSTCFLARGAMSGRGTHVWAIDAWGLPGNTPGRFRFDKAFPAFMAQLATAGVAEHVTAVLAFSVDAAAKWGGPAIGLLYIDGSHYYEDVLADFTAWEPHLAPQAIIAWDDYASVRNPGVNRAVNELLAAGVIYGRDTSHPPLAVTRLTDSEE